MSGTPLAPVSCDQTANFTHEMGNKEESVMRIGMIGAGWQGGTLAKQLAKAGHEVRVANRRGLQSLQEFAKQTGTIASTVEDAATNAELIMIALPFKAIPSLPKSLFKDLPDSVTIVALGPNATPLERVKASRQVFVRNYRQQFGRDC